MTRLGEWWSRCRRELDHARRENEQAREQVAKTLEKARERGVTVRLSQAALQRIATLEQHN